MSVKVMTAVFERYPNGGGEMLLALALADHASDDGTKVFPFVKSLAEKTRQSIRSVQYQLRRMEEAGWLILVNAGNGGRGQSSEYQINPDWIKGADFASLKRVQSEAGKGATDDAKGANDDEKGSNGLHPHITVIEPSVTIKEPSSMPARAALPRFDEFWSVYPDTSRRVAKAKCRDTWKKKKLDGVADEIISHVQAMKTTKQWLAGYEPAPLTYLNQERWEDGLPTTHPAAAGAAKHGNFANQDYRSGVGADGSF
uniref:helix-turn-helix domain-containing protein n=1 Tax=Castellaniella defragrans TaxID=75697 RepID=UPI00333E8C5F